jgi:RecB family endonuclease NucS
MFERSINPEFAGRINKDLSEKKLIVMMCGCSIEYWGRSRSIIKHGHRMVIIKQDSTLLIHSISGYKPVNWMNEPAETVAQANEDNTLILHCQRTKKPFEEMKVAIDEIIDYRAYEGLEDKEKLDLTHTEKDMQDHLSKNPKLVHPDFRLISTEHPTPLGFFDLYGKINERYVVVELKVETAGLPAALQVKRYRDWLKQHIGEADGILIAPRITPNALNLLRKEKIEFKKMSVHAFELKRRKDKTLKEWL